MNFISAWNVVEAPYQAPCAWPSTIITSSPATAFWQTLADANGAFDEPFMTSQFTRFVNLAQAHRLEPSRLSTVSLSLDKLLAQAIGSHCHHL